MGPKSTYERIFEIYFDYTYQGKVRVNITIKPHVDLIVHSFFQTSKYSIKFEDNLAKIVIDDGNVLEEFNNC